MIYLKRLALGFSILLYATAAGLILGLGACGLLYAIFEHSVLALLIGLILLVSYWIGKDVR